MIHKHPAPVAVFVYNRLDHTKRTLEALRKNTLAAETALIVFSDGAADEEDAEMVQQVRDYLGKLAGFESITIKSAAANQGLAPSIITGVSSVLETNDTVIVLEDDLETSPGFLTYMNDALNVYRESDKVMQISGYTFPVRAKLPRTFFLPMAASWGWATWNRAWSLFTDDAATLLTKLEAREDLERFTFGGARDQVASVRANATGRKRTWLSLWNATVFLNDGLVLYPGKSLVRNIGHDGTGVHCRPEPRLQFQEIAKRVSVDRQPPEESSRGRRAYVRYFLGRRYPLWLVKQVLRKVLPGTSYNRLKALLRRR